MSGKPDRWQTLEYEGPALPAPYQPKGLSIKVRGQAVKLSPLGEEMAVAMAKKTKYWEDEVFVRNFLVDFCRAVPEANDVDFKEMDFGKVVSHVEDEKLIKKNESKESEKKKKAERDALKEKHGFAVVDGAKVQVANWMAEPPGILMGRLGKPIRGKWKYGVTEKDITLNCTTTSDPDKWGKIVQDKTSMWLARWDDKLLGKEKYVWLHESTGIQQSRNKEKYDKALKVAEHIEKVRERIKEGMMSRDEKTRKVATICWLIDKVGIRVGNEKGEDEADTKGVTTLEVQNMTIQDSTVGLDFLGKDSVEFTRTISEPNPEALRNLQQFTSKKKPDEKIFEGVDSEDVNRFLSAIVPGMSAKVFRTFHASRIVREYLEAHTGKDENENYYNARMANLEAAKFLNHKRTLPPTWEESLKKKEQKVKEIKAKPKAKPDRVKKAEMDLDLMQKTKDYNLGTSLKNYCDPRIYKAWADSVGLEWAKIYSKTLQKKFAWVGRSKWKWGSSEPQSTEE